MLPSKLAPSLAGALAMAVGSMVLVGWAFDIAALKSILPGWVSMKPNTALCFIMAGLSLWLQSCDGWRVTRDEKASVPSPATRHPLSWWAACRRLVAQISNLRYTLCRSVAPVCAGLVALIGALTLAEYLGGWDLGIDQLLFREPPGAIGTSHPGRMAPLTALNFVLLGLALRLLDRKTKGGCQFSQWLAVLALVVALLAFVGYLYGVQSFYRIVSYTGMAPHTSVAFLMLCVGVLVARWGQGFMVVFSNHGPRGTVARRLLPAAVGLPFFLGWLHLEGERAGLYEKEFSLALLILVIVAVLVALIGWTAESLHRADRERGRAEAAMRKSEERFRSLVSATCQIVWTTDAGGNVTDDVPDWRAYTGQSYEQTKGTGWVEALHPEDRQRTLAIWQRAVEAHSLYDTQYRVRRHDGEYRHFAARGAPVLEPDGRIREWVGTCTDITERLRAIESQARLVTAVEQAAESIMITDAEGRIVYVNPAFETICGYTRQDAAGQHASILKSGKHDAGFYQQLWATITRGKVWTGHFLNKKKNGELYEAEANISPVHNAAGEIINHVCVQRDVSHEMQLETQLRQSQKMEAIGRLAGGVAHDFNNLLTVMRGRADLVLYQLPPGSQHAADLQEVVHAVERAASLTRQLLTFSRQQPLQVRPLDLNAVVNDISKMLRRIAGEDITLRVRCADALPTISADVGMMEQVIMNLAVNARDAMLKGGQFTLETTVEQIGAEYVGLHAEAAAGLYVCLSVSDTGCGIPAGVLPRIFEPFFTTKEVGKGTGLGLATVYGIVKQHLGWINVYSEVNQGTVFRIYLPAAAAAASVAAPAAPPAKPARGGTETILIVEDDDAVREMVRLFLARQGYRILEAGSGVAALEVWKEQADRIDLVLTDMVMPDGLSGWELAEVLWAHKPELKIIYTSGYSAESVGHEFVAHGQFHFLQKPYDPRKLLEMVRQCLDGQSETQTGHGPSA